MKQDEQKDSDGGVSEHSEKASLKWESEPWRILQAEEEQMQMLCE